jgi:hypothetical protein
VNDDYYDILPVRPGMAELKPKSGLSSILLQLSQLTKHHNTEFDAMLHKLVTELLNKPQEI